MECDLDSFLEDGDREMMKFLDDLRGSESFSKLSHSLKEKIDLYIRAYRGDPEAMILLSYKVGFYDRGKD